MKEVVVAKAKSSALYTLHLLEGEFGQNAATQLIDKHKEHSQLVYKHGPADFSMRMRRARDYRKKIHPDVLLLLDALSGLQAGGLAVRNDQERQFNVPLFNEIMKDLSSAVQDPTESVVMFDKIDKEMKRNAEIAGSL